MKSLNTGHRQRNIKSMHFVKIRILRREKAEVQTAVGLLFLLILCICILTQLQIGVMGVVSDSMEDALAASNLASALIDIEEYGISHKMIIKDFSDAYETFCEALQENLNLNERWEREDRMMICGNVKVECYILYNVYGGMVYVCGMDENGNLTEYSGAVGSVEAPNGILIETTAVYSEISFPVKGFLGMEQTAHKGKLVDICIN